MVDSEIEGLDGCLAEMAERGFTVIPDFITQDEVARIRHAFETEVQVTRLIVPRLGNVSGKTIRAHNLLAKTRAIDYLFLDPILRALVDGVLGKAVQINIVTLFNLLPGETKQKLHQDDGLWPIPRPHPEFVCNALIAIDDFDEENGATHIVPCSHKWHDRRVDQGVETLQATMRSGSLLMWAGSLWHAGGANTSRDRERLALFMSHNVTYLRQQENQFIAVPREVVQQMPEQLQRLVGYQNFGGGIDFRDPLDVLKDGKVIHPEAKVAHSGWGKL